MLERLCQSVEHSLDAADLCLQLRKFADWMEFENSSLFLAVDYAEGTFFKTIFNFPEAYLPIFTSSGGASDPVMQHCKRSNLPLIWDQKIYVNSGMGHQWELQAPFGMQAGLALTVHLPGGLHVHMGLERSGQLPRTFAQTRKILAAAQLFFAHASPAALRVLGSKEARDTLLAESEREMLDSTSEQMSVEQFIDQSDMESQRSLQCLMDGVRVIERIKKWDALLLARKMGLIQSSLRNF